MPKHSPVASVFYVTLGVALVAIGSLAIVAQSGRRVRKPELAPVAAPQATPSPTPAEKPKPAFTFILGLDKYGNFSRVPLNTYSGVLRSCAGRLDDSPSVKAEITNRDMSRSAAIQQAKAETEAYVVWLQLHSNTSGGVDEIYGDPNNIYIEYTVFAPTTAKQVTTGSTFPEAYRNRRVRLPTPTTDGDYYLNQAARGAAERILDHFHLHPSNTRP
jgi:hypothetical protein